MAYDCIAETLDHPLEGGFALRVALPGAALPRLPGGHLPCFGSESAQHGGEDETQGKDADILSQILAVIFTDSRAAAFRAEGALLD